VTNPETLPAGLDVDTRLAIADFLYLEAELLDERRFQDWLELFDDDATYEVPVRVTREKDAPWELAPSAHIFDDTKQTLAIRVQRLATDFAWAEQPPSRTRHFVTNIRAEASPQPGEYLVRSSTLVYRTRGEQTTADLVSAQRRDVVRHAVGRWTFARRWAALDQSVVGLHNLSIFI
jgi:3-phenylpropionate/cinnamic acid dioxygenase small subunit